MSQYDNVKRNVVDEIMVIAPIFGQQVSYNTSTQSAAFQTSTTQVVLMCTTDCYVSFGLNPTATTTAGANNYSIRAGLLYPFTVLDRNVKIAVIKATAAAAGVLDIIEGR